jgi:cephalosporin hydroxylase
MLKGVADAFHALWWYAEPWNYQRTRWLGTPVFQCPMDLWIQQEIITETRPTLIVETGSAFGGSALFFVSVFNGRVISIDDQHEMRPVIIQDRIEFLKGRSDDPEIVGRVTHAAAGERVMVFLDSDHRCEHVLKELELYSPLVTPGCYMVAHDTNLDGAPISDARFVDKGPGEAVRRFLMTHPEFEVDRTRERLILTFSPGGWLRRREEKT